MTKKIFLGMALVGLLAACTDDYKDWLDPQVVGQPEKVSFGDGSISTVGVIDFNTVTDEMVKVCSITAPTASDASFTPSYTITLGGEKTFDIGADGLMKALSNGLLDPETAETALSAQDFLNKLTVSGDDFPNWGTTKSKTMIQGGVRASNRAKTVKLSNTLRAASYFINRIKREKK